MKKVIYFLLIALSIILIIAMNSKRCKYCANMSNKANSAYISVKNKIKRLI